MLKLVLLMFAFNAFAEPSCLVTRECFEHEGKIIDLRSKAGQELDKISDCDPLIENCLSQIQDENLPVLSHKDFKRLTQNDRPELFIPLDLKSSDMMILAGAMSLGIVVFQNDREIMDFVQENKTETLGKARTIGNLLGREAIAPIAAGSYFMGAVLKNGKLKKIGLFTVTAGLATQIVTEAFKKSFNRKRPNASNDPYDFFEENSYSFFSGHASGAFSLATVIAEVYKDKPLVPYLAYGAAAITAYARMHDNKHWASDVLAGAVAGHLITKILIRTFENKKTSGGLVITPSIGIDSAGVAVQWTPSREKKLQCSKSGLQGRALIESCINEIFEDSDI